jgi:hypothetical protein
MNLEVLEKTGRSVWLVAMCLLCGEHDLPAQRAVNVLAPPEAATIFDGNSYAQPFDTAGRFQQVYDASVFSNRLPEGGGFVRQLVFRVDANAGHSFEDTLPSVQLNLSTTLKSSDGLSSIFADNVGSDDVAVLGPRSVPLSGGGGGGVTGFNVLFDFRDRPFYYNPANGNLLVDFRIHQGFGGPFPPGRGAILDAFSVTGDSISSVYAYDSSSLTSGQLSTLGLATDFVFLPIPEPSSLVLLCTAFGLLFLARKRVRKG